MIHLLHYFQQYHKLFRGLVKVVKAEDLSKPARAGVIDKNNSVVILLDWDEIVVLSSRALAAFNMTNEGALAYVGLRKNADLDLWALRSSAELVANSQGLEKEEWVDFVNKNMLDNAKIFLGTMDEEQFQKLLAMEEEKKIRYFERVVLYDQSGEFLSEEAPANY